MPKGTARGEPASTANEKSVLETVGLTDQVELRRSWPPSSLDKSPRDLDSIRAVCPISRTSLK